MWELMQWKKDNKRLFILPNQKYMMISNTHAHTHTHKGGNGNGGNLDKSAVPGHGSPGTRPKSSTDVVKVKGSPHHGNTARFLDNDTAGAM